MWHMLGRHSCEETTWVAVNTLSYHSINQRWHGWLRTHVLADIRPYVCTYPQCNSSADTYQSKSAFEDHESSIHQSSSRNIGAFNKICLFCGEPSNSKHSHVQNVGRHMEEIAFTVVAKPYEAWEFYTDSSSGISAKELEVLQSYRTGLAGTESSPSTHNKQQSATT